MILQFSLQNFQSIPFSGFTFSPSASGHDLPLLSLYLWCSCLPKFNLTEYLRSLHWGLFLFAQMHSALETLLVDSPSALQPNSSYISLWFLSCYCSRSLGILSPCSFLSLLIQTYPEMNLTNTQLYVHFQSKDVCGGIKGQFGLGMGKRTRSVCFLIKPDYEVFMPRSIELHFHHFWKDGFDNLIILNSSKIL